jgi:hypothetical protein
VIVFDSEGAELTRIPGGIDIQAYANILELTLDKDAPVSDLVNSFASDRTELNEKECRLLAYNSLGQIPGVLEELDEETEQADTIGAIRTDVLAICDNFEDQEGSYETCQSFLERA